VKFLRLRSSETTVTEPVDEEVEVSSAVGTRAYTPAKGRPTPKRREAEGRRRGPVAPPPTTQREAYKRSRGTKADRRAESNTRRERMAAGDPRYLMPRDKGPVKAFVRNEVDSGRHLLGLLMPLALLMVVVMLSPASGMQLYITPAVMAVIVVMVLEGLFLSRRVVKKVREKFPDAPDRAASLGWYAAMRASQIRRLRVPKPIVKPGGGAIAPRTR
jgi:hypothetical protein